MNIFCALLFSLPALFHGFLCSVLLPLCGIPVRSGIVDQERSGFGKGKKKRACPKTGPPLFSIQRMVYSPVLFLVSIRFTASTGIIRRR